MRSMQKTKDEGNGSLCPYGLVSNEDSVLVVPHAMHARRLPTPAVSTTDAYRRHTE